MAGYLNKVMVIGNLGRDPELATAKNGNQVVSFSVATTERYNDKNGQKQEVTEWHNIVVWGKQAPSIAQYLSKGSSVYVEGKIATRSWEKDGQKHYKTEIMANVVQFLDSKGSSQDAGGGFQQQQGQQFGGAPQQFGQQQQQAPQGQFPPQGANGLPVEDELPF